MQLNPEMTNEKAAMLLRCALIEDASNTGERVAALTAEIDVDGEFADIIVDEDLWPDLDKAHKTREMAKSLWIEIEWVGSVGSSPFAWPGLGAFSHSIVEYYTNVMAAYSSQKPKDESK